VGHVPVFALCATPRWCKLFPYDRKRPFSRLRSTAGLTESTNMSICHVLSQEQLHFISCRDDNESQHDDLNSSCSDGSCWIYIYIYNCRWFVVCCRFLRKNDFTFWLWTGGILIANYRLIVVFRGRDVLELRLWAPRFECSLCLRGWALPERSFSKVLSQPFNTAVRGCWLQQHT